MWHLIPPEGFHTLIGLQSTCIIIDLRCDSLPTTKDLIISTKTLLITGLLYPALLWGDNYRGTCKNFGEGWQND
jgi:hypothetical protein